MASLQKSLRGPWSLTPKLELYLNWLLHFFFLFWGLKTFNQLSSQDIWFLCTPALVDSIWGKKCQNHTGKAVPEVFSFGLEAAGNGNLRRQLFSRDFPVQFCWPKHSSGLDIPWISNYSLRHWFFIPITIKVLGSPAPCSCILPSLDLSHDIVLPGLLKAFSFPYRNTELWLGKSSKCFQSKAVNIYLAPTTSPSDV